MERTGYIRDYRIKKNLKSIQNRGVCSEEHYENIYEGYIRDKFLSSNKVKLYLVFLNDDDFRSKLPR